VILVQRNLALGEASDSLLQFVGSNLACVVLRHGSGRSDR